MRSMIFALAAGASLAFSVGAEAMPAAPVAQQAAPEVTLVAGGCGIGFHRGPYGGCRPNYYRPAYGYYRPYYRPYARCGIRVGPIGIGGPC